MADEIRTTVKENLKIRTHVAGSTLIVEDYNERMITVYDENGEARTRPMPDTMKWGEW